MGHPDKNLAARIAFDYARMAIDQALVERDRVLVLSPYKIGVLSDLPESLRLLADLEGLWVPGHQLTHLPAWVSELRNLRVLDVSNNKLETLPESLGALENLELLGASQNQLTHLPNSMANLKNLKKLNLSSNKIVRLPKSLGQLTQLQDLILRSNSLSYLPPSMGELKDLRRLTLSGNQISCLESQLQQLVQLQSLFLAGNELEYLPEWIGKLQRLRCLDLSHNQLSSLPESVRDLQQLIQLDLRGNERLGLPEEIAARDFKYPSQTPSEILDYYVRIRGTSGRQINECKLIVVGRGGAGKTSVIKRLCGKLYDPNEPETHGINIQKLTFDGQHGTVTSRVWDFGGQVVLHSMHEFFLTARSLYLLVLGERDDMLERDAAYWLQLIRSYAGKAPVVVAVNKSAGRQRHFDYTSLEDNYGPILGWVFTECSEVDLEKAGIVELQRALTAALDSPHMDSVRRKFPSKWFEIKEVLEGMNESFLDYEAFVKRCEAHGENDPKEQAALAADLHDLGVALNYGRDARLRDTTVLRPDWLANGIYAVLRANDLDSKYLPGHLNVEFAPNGIVTADTMSRIHAKAQAWKMLRVQDYPQDKRHFLLRLMGLFHLSYPLDDAGTQHLVPTLLPLHPPESATEPEDTGRIRLRYEFQVVPAPLLPWFIARTFSMIPDRLHWRRGAMLAFGDARARVWTTQDERYVFVTVAGDQHDQNRLVSIIRSIFQDLFSDYQGLRPVEQWEHNGKWVPRETLEDFGVLPRAQRNLEELYSDGAEVRP